MSAIKNKSCKICGYTLSRFYDTGLLGCPACYEAFKNEITAAVKNVQCGKTVHCGVSPDVENKRLLSRYKKLLEQKELALLERHFDVTADLTDEIFALSEELKVRGLI